MLRAVSGSVQGADQQRAERKLPAVVERLVRVAGVSRAVHVDASAGGRHQATVTRYVIGMVVGLQHVLDAHAAIAGQLEVLVDLEARVHHRGYPRPLIADQIGGTTEVVVGDLLEEHQGFAWLRRVSLMPAAPARA